MEERMNKASFSSASTFPAKVLKNLGYCYDESGYILPVHLQLSPTNKCNLSCKYCSCSKRDKDQVLSLEKAEEILDAFYDWGCMAVTITGGGEPLLYPWIDELVEYCVDELGIKAGMATNGILLADTKVSTLSKLTWCRVSLSDDRNIDKILNDVAILSNCVPCDWAFSYVVTDTPNFAKIAEVVRVSNACDGVTHVRLVSDVLGNRDLLEDIKEHLDTRGISDKKVIYQDRKNPEHGAKDCLISLLRPLVGADGRVYPCCGIQYAEATPSLGFSSSMCMGDDMRPIWEKQKHFDGSGCSRCYYGDYNRLLSIIVDEEITHLDFV
jgi:MoaA/NifB/PqqE/SkfB family radical SAM enzyme